MIKYCYEKWDKNKEDLKKALIGNPDLKYCKYKDLVGLIVKHILNKPEKKWSCEKIIEIGGDDYQGALIFVIPTIESVQSETDCLMTNIGYGSCSLCDTLQYIQDLPLERALEQCEREDKIFEYDEEENIIPTDEQLECYMRLCKDLVCNIIKPYNTNEREMELFKTVEF